MISDNSSQSSRITLVDKDRIISDDRKFPKTFDTSFENAVGNLNIKDVINSPEVNSTSTGINIYILKYRDQPSITSIRQNLQFVNLFIFSEITETDTEREVLKLNPKKAGTFGNYPKSHIRVRLVTWHLKIYGIL